VEDDITPLGHEVFQIDTRMAGYEGITAGYLIRGERPCLVETGTAPSAPVVRDALTRLGVGAADLATVVVTHIHLDHAGGAGDIAAMFPGAQIVVHQRGARHLADPSRLMAGARQVYGDALDRLFGVLVPVPADRIVALEDTGTIDLGGGRRLDSYYSPGHAKHHVGLVDSDTGDLYTGDAAGVYIPDTGDLRPATPPPDFDLQTALATVQRFAALRPTRLLFSHYGPVTEVEPTLERSAEEIRLWVQETRRARAAGLDLDHAVAMVVERTKSRYAALAPDADPALAVKIDRISGSALNVSGIMYWLDQTEAAHPAVSLRGCRVELGTSGEQEVVERAPDARRGLAGSQGFGQVGRAARKADSQDDDRGQGIVEAEFGADGGAVEAAHLMHVEPVSLCLSDERGDGLTGVVQRPGSRIALFSGGGGRDQDQRAGPARPGLVAGG
jgi:glyoxylase-like metal-dependent hydrolase (beta-lactamase superfamily II)